MTLKKAKIIDLFGIFGLSFLFHFMYEWMPNPIFACFLPVNESIFEHMKLFVSSTLIWGIIDYLILKKNNLERNNFLFQLLLRSILSIIIYLPIYYLLRSIFGENMIITISLMFIVYIISVIISYKLLTYRDLRINNVINIIFIIIIYFIFSYFTFNPMHTPFFYDTNNQKYGI